MSEENLFETAGNSGAGKTTPDFSVTVEDPKGDGGKAANGSGNEDKDKPGHEAHDRSNIEYTSEFKKRVDRIRRNEKAKFDAELKKRDEAWEKRFKELESRFGGQAPKILKREDFKTDEEFTAAKREAAIDEIMKRIDERNGAKSKQEEEERLKQESDNEAQRRFALKFQEGMQRTLSQEQQKEVIGIANDADGAVNTFLQSTAGSTLQKWLFEDCTIPADVILYLEHNADKMEILGTLSPRKQMEQLDILERHLAKAAADAAKKKGQDGNPANPEDDPDDSGRKKPPVIGQFGGSSRAISDFSKLSDQERVSRLIKAMRSR